MRKNKLVLIFCALLALLALFIAPARAQEATPSADEVNQVARDLYCPVCENIPLDVCPTQACADWRALIAEKLTAGWSDQQIKDYFVAQYGDRVLGVPPTRGLTLNWLIYIIPLAAIAGGGAVLYRAVRGWQRPGQASVVQPVDQPQTDDGYLKKLEDELRKG